MDHAGWPDGGTGRLSSRGIPVHPGFTQPLHLKISKTSKYISKFAFISEETSRTFSLSVISGHLRRARFKVVRRLYLGEKWNLMLGFY